MSTATSKWIRKLEEGSCAREFDFLYGEDAGRQIGRYRQAIVTFESFFGERASRLISVGGRTELCGNHTDHQQGRVLAAAVTRDILAVAAVNDGTEIRLIAPPFGRITLSTDDLQARSGEAGRPEALLRGIAYFLSREGYRLGGCDIYLDSEVLVGSGLSSSAAFEVLMGNLFSRVFNGGGISSSVIARAGQFAENDYFGKPCGLMDQLTCATGGALQIDFKDREQAVLEHLPCDFDSSGYGLFLVNTGSSHAQLTEAYAAIPREMEDVARALGHRVLREVEPEIFYAKLKALRSQVTDRAIMRAKHFFEENARVSRAAEALCSGDMESYRQLMAESGRSSMDLLQNSWPESEEERSLALALAVSGDLLGARGACRVHGGGFAGTMQALVPDALEARFVRVLDDLFGQGACQKLEVRPVGGYELEG